MSGEGQHIGLEKKSYIFLLGNETKCDNYDRLTLIWRNIGIYFELRNGRSVLTNVLNMF